MVVAGGWIIGRRRQSARTALEKPSSVDDQICARDVLVLDVSNQTCIKLGERKGEEAEAEGLSIKPETLPSIVLGSSKFQTRPWPLDGESNAGRWDLVRSTVQFPLPLLSALPCRLASSTSRQYHGLLNDYHPKFKLLPRPA